MVSISFFFFSSKSLLVSRLLAILDLLSYRSTVETLHVHVRRLEPPKRDEDLRKWIMDRWTEKDELLQQFEEFGEFPGEEVEVQNLGWKGDLFFFFFFFFFFLVFLLVNLRFSAASVLSCRFISLLCYSVTSFVFNFHAHDKRHLIVTTNKFFPTQ